MNELKDIFSSFAEASRIGQRLQIAADKAMKEEREAYAMNRAFREERLQEEGTEMEARTVDERHPWNDDLNPQ